MEYDEMADSHRMSKTNRPHKVSLRDARGEVSPEESPEESHSF